MKAGDVFRIVNKADRHARVIVSDPVHFPDRVLFVGMTSWDPREDQSCILDVGDHSAVFHLLPRPRRVGCRSPDA